MTKRYNSEFWPVVAGVVLCELVGIAGGLVTSKAIPDWYQHLKKPSINPPSWVFGPVWTLLYALMGWAVAIVFKKEGFSHHSRALNLFGIQLWLNFVWTLLFFGWRSPFAAFIGILLLWVAIVSTMIAFWKISKKASLLLLPYLLWVSFASVLNALLWRLNAGK